MKSMILSIASTALLMAASLAAFAQPGASAPATMEGKDAPILLARVVVTATPLD